MMSSLPYLRHFCEHEWLLLRELERKQCYFRHKSTIPGMASTSPTASMIDLLINSNSLCYLKCSVMNV